ncbi:MAG: Nif3-like dinuclear metal center hexameric protein [Flavobacteriaceae bacterium]
MTIKEITNHLEELAPLAHAEEFDNVGLLVGDFETEITSILVSLDTLEATVDEAIEKKCNLIVSFHPIIFSGLKKINGASYVERVAIKAIKNDIAIYSMHTALDNSFEGVSAKMCDVLGLQNRQFLLPKESGKTGMGMLAEFPSAMTEKDFLQLLKVKFNAKGIRHSILLNKSIKKVALLGGSGSFAIAQAKALKADAYVSSDFKYHDFFKAENNIVLIDIGHYESEQYTKNLLVDYLNKKSGNFAVILSQKNTNPINYL